MNLLAVESSTEYCSLAVSNGERVRGRHFHAGQRHSELLLPALRELLQEFALDMGAIEGIAYGAGPGSFTGLRIACGVAQGLAIARNLPVAGIGTLLALAEDSDADNVIACLDARMGEVYHAIYQKQGDQWMETHAPALYKPDSVPRVEGRGWVGRGSGFRAHVSAMAQRYDGNLARIDADAVPRAAAMLRLAVTVFASGRGKDAAEAVPLYLRDKVALKTSER